MTSLGIPGYRENASELMQRYEEVSFPQKHQELIALIPRQCARALDIGAGAGGDAAWLAARGCHVVAVEPTAEFRDYARRHHSPKIEWLDDRLPGLPEVSRLGQVFDLILISAVWMHLDESERKVAMPIVASLLVPDGLLYISLRHGPVPEGRRMFEIPPSEVIASARACGLDLRLNVEKPSAQKQNRDAGITWSQLAFVKRTPV
jgi:SAM-dependent methyltransferase